MIFVVQEYLHCSDATFPTFAGFPNCLGTTLFSSHIRGVLQMHLTRYVNIGIRTGINYHVKNHIGIMRIVREITEYMGNIYDYQRCHFSYFCRNSYIFAGLSVLKYV